MAVKEAINVHKSLVIINDDVIQLVAVHSPNYSIDPSRVKGIEEPNQYSLKTFEHKI